MLTRALPCPTCGCGPNCPVCDGDGTPTQIQVTISGIADSATCLKCNTVNGTWVLDYIGDEIAPCTWEYRDDNFDMTGCTAFDTYDSGIKLTLVRILGAGTSKFRLVHSVINASTLAYTTHASWDTQVWTDGEAPCMTFFNEALTLFNGSALCDYTASSAALTT